MKSGQVVVFLLYCILLCLASAPAELPGRRLWVLQAPDHIVELEPSTWAARDTRQIPAGAVKDPRNFCINGKGQMLFRSAPQGEEGSPDRPGASDKVWFWNGRSAVFLDRSAAEPTVLPGGNHGPAVERTPVAALSADGRRLYWFENEFRIFKDADGIEASVVTTFRAWQTDLDGGQRTQIANHSFERCKCETGACSETCPEAAFWFPDEGVDNFFIVNHWIPGQIGATYQASFVYLNSERKWSPTRLPLAMEEILDATRGGAIILHRILDGGCCGWDNESNDQARMFANSKDLVIYDEYQSYANPDYDVSFFVSKAGLSPDTRSAAMTIESTAMPGADIRLSDQGKPNPEELSRIREAMTQLPAVAIVRLQDPPKRLAFLPHASFAGWLNEKEMLVVEHGVLVAFQIETGARRKSRINVANPAFVFVR